MAWKRELNNFFSVQSLGEVFHWMLDGNEWELMVTNSVLILIQF